MDNNNIEIIAYHGWGFDASFWQPFEQLVSDAIEWKNFDRGYFGNAQSHSFKEKSSAKIIFTHSYGLHLVNDALFKQADAVIIFSGFLRFHPKAAQFRRRSKQVVGEMINRFDDRPYDVLKTFYRNVYHPEKTYGLPSKAINKPLLLGDLEMLNDSNRSLFAVQKSAKVFIFHGAEDAIVPKMKGRTLFEKFGSRAQYFEIKQSGHALPVTHAQKCWQIIEPEIEELIK